ncbi:MAG: hypothetical protein IJW86_01330 [Clostridia bacterium]|nr:hypothetical protein [Clostridia bacterium]
MDNRSNEITFSDVTKGVVIALCLVILLGAGYIMGIIFSPNNSISVDNPQESFTVQNPENIKEVEIKPIAPGSVTTTTSVQSAETTTAVPEEETTAKAPQSDMGTAAEKTTKPDKPESKEKTTAEIVALFNESANRIKGEATKVVKNYEYRTVNTEHLVVPDALQSMAEEMMTKFMGDDLEPIEYTTAEEIAEEYMVPSQSYVSVLKAEDVKEATFKDNGTEYEITIKAKDSVNPTSGTGVGAAFDVIETTEVKEKTSMIEKFDSQYYDCVVKCKIDKATGKMTWSNYTVSVILDCSVKVIKVFDVKCGMTFEKDYNIYY